MAIKLSFHASINPTTHIVDYLRQFWADIFEQFTYLLDAIDVVRNPVMSYLLPKNGKDRVNRLFTPKSLH